MKLMRRSFMDRLSSGFKSNRMIILVGSRQVGKTTVMRMHQAALPPGAKSFYFNLEDVLHLDACQTAQSLKAHLGGLGVDLERHKVLLIIDEFQYIKNATKMFKAFYDLYPSVSILASGSSSIEVQKHLKESLAGRKRVYNLYPLSFDEFLMFRGAGGRRDDGAADLSRISAGTVATCNKRHLVDFLTYGGYPKIALLKNRNDKIEELKDIYDSYIQKDIRSLVKGEDIHSYNNLLKILASRSGNLVNVHELTNTLGMERRDLTRHLSLLEHTFIIKTLPPFFSNKRSEIAKMPKLFFLDTGIANYSTKNFSVPWQRPDIGSLVETFVFGEILKVKPVHYNMYFWRTKTGTEIDFILEGDDELLPVEVKWQTMAKPQIPRSFHHFFEAHPKARRAVVVTKDLQAELTVGRTIIHFVPAVLIGRFMDKELV